MASKRKVTFEKISEDENGATYHVQALHVGTTRNHRKYSKEELVLGGRSLSYRPINVNHQEDRWLPYDFGNPTSENSNTTLIMDFDPEKNGVVGEVWITDKPTRENIDAGNIRTVSIEQVPSKGEMCACMMNECTCEENGVVFTGIALLETHKGVEPGDPNASITARKESMMIKSKPEIMAAIKKLAEDDACMIACLQKKTDAGVTIDDQAVAICFSECYGGETKEGCGCKGKEQEEPCPPGQHRMPDGTCMDDDAMEAFKCEVCGAEFEDKDKLAAHMAEHEKEQTERIRRQFLEAVERESRKLVQAD